jgi:hypothetical protein
MVGVPLFFATSSHFLPYAVGACLLFVVLLLTLRIQQD